MTMIEQLTFDRKLTSKLIIINITSSFLNILLVKYLSIHLYIPHVHRTFLVHRFLCGKKIKKLF